MVRSLPQASQPPIPDEDKLQLIKVEINKDYVLQSGTTCAVDLSVVIHGVFRFTPLDIARDAVLGECPVKVRAAYEHMACMVVDCVCRVLHHGVALVVVVEPVNLGHKHLKTGSLPRARQAQHGL